VTPSRLRLARHRRAMTLTALSRASGVPLRTLSAYENAHHCPPDATVLKLAIALDVTPAFLAGDDVDLLEPDVVSFRKLSRTTAGRRDAALAAGRIAIEIADWVEDRFRLPAPDLPTLEKHAPETAAEMVRQRWGLGERPVPNAVHLLEAHGVRVFSLADDCREVDAFSLIRDDRPFVFLNTDRSAERQRFDAAHELGHLLLHSGAARVHGRDREAEANRFAAAFLMPRRAVVAQGLREATVEAILAAKQHWVVSAMALTHRLHELHLLSDWNYRTTCVALSREGYRTAEPGGARPEVSQVLTKVLAALRQRDGVQQLADHLGLSVDELNRHLFRLVPTALAGGAETSPGRASLRLVDS
jgi:Zn-dependent peptidase ImmA (M78 family)